MARSRRSDPSSLCPALTQNRDSSGARSSPFVDVPWPKSRRFDRCNTSGFRCVETRRSAAVTLCPCEISSMRPNCLTRCKATQLGAISSSSNGKLVGQARDHIPLLMSNFTRPSSRICMSIVWTSSSEADGFTTINTEWGFAWLVERGQQPLFGHLRFLHADRAAIPPLRHHIRNRGKTTSEIEVHDAPRRAEVPFGCVFRSDRRGSAPGKRCGICRRSRVR